VTRLAAIAAALLMLVAAVQLQAARERLYPPPAVDADVVYVSSGDALRRLTGAYNGLGADVYWVRAIQYFGATRRRLTEERRGPEPPPMLAAAPDEYPALYPLLDITTSLDPRFNIAYRFGAVFLAEPYPGGPGRPDLAIKLLEKGLAERPDKWEYMEDIGFVHYWYLRDYQAASAWFKKAADLPNAPWWLRSLAATTLAQGGDRASSRLMWQGIRESAEIDWLRRDADRRLAQLQVLDEIDALQKRVDAYASRPGGPFIDWASLVRAGAFPGVPLDPTRTPYELDAKGRVRLSEKSSLWPLPDEPMQLDARPPS
jgi:tetratricopeptide (TPR) repeat protein